MQSPLNQEKTSYFTRSKSYFSHQSNLVKVGIVLIGLMTCCCLCGLPLSFFPSSSNPTAVPGLAETEIAHIVETQLVEHLPSPTVELQPTHILPTQILPPESVPTIPQVDSLPVVPGILAESKVTGNLVVTFIDVGQGDSILIQSPDGKYGLIDGGEAGSGALQYLQSKGVGSLDLVVATHPHSDHIGGLVEILNTIPASRVVTNGQQHTTGVYENFLDAIIASTADYQEVKRGDQLVLGDLVFDVLHPNELVGDDFNRNSLVLRLKYGQAIFLFMGDANKDSDVEILASGQDVRSNIFKVGHHSSKNSFTAEFLAAVSPQVAIYSAGAGNDYDHPVPTTIDALVGAGAQVYGTDQYGTITVITNSESYRVDQEKEPALVPANVPFVPAQQPAAAAMAIAVSSLSSPIQRGSNASISIQTSPGANCSISVIYKSGPSNAAGLGPQIANGNGIITWSWKVGTKTTPGTWSIHVSCNQGGNSSTISVPFEVTG